MFVITGLYIYHRSVYICVHMHNDAFAHIYECECVFVNTCASMCACACESAILAFSTSLKAGLFTASFVSSTILNRLAEQVKDRECCVCDILVPSPRDQRDFQGFFHQIQSVLTNKQVL